MRSNLYFVFILLFALVALHIVTGELILTGDEPRYFYGSVSFWEAGNLLLSSDAWAQWQRDNGLSGDMPAGHGIHSIIHSFLISPVVGMFGSFAAGRWVQLLIGMAPFLFMLKKHPARWGVDACVLIAIYFISIPIFPYLRMLYSEIWLFSVFSIVLILLFDERPSRVAVWLVIVMALSLPFFHIRMSLVAAACLAYMAYKIHFLKIFTGAEKILAVFVLCVSVILFIKYNIYISGGAVSASAPFAPSFALLFDRLATQFFSFRHGVILYSPIFLLGLAGLIVGVAKRQSFISFCAFLLALYFLTFIWGSASESYTARFWVAIVPVIMIGTVYYWRSTQGFSRYMVAAPLVAITLANAILFFANSNLFLENRFGSTSYDYIYSVMSSLWGRGLHFDIIALADPFDFSLAGPDGRPSVFQFFLFFLVFLLSICGVALRRRYLSALSAMTFLVALVWTMNAATFSMINPAEYIVERGVNEKQQSYVSVLFKGGSKLGAVRIGEYRDVPLWGIDKTYPKSFLLTVQYTTGEQISPILIGGRQLIGLNLGPQPVSAITLTAVEEGVTSSWLDLNFSFLTHGLY